MDVNPYAWISTLPMTVALVALYFQPSDNVLKRWWSQLQRFEEDVWSQIGGPAFDRRTESRRLHTLAYWGLVVALLAGSLYSLAVWLEFLPTR